MPVEAIQTALTFGPLPPIRLHDLRHTSASLTYRATLDLKIVAELVGHSSIQFTGDIYTSVFAEADREAAQAAADLVPRKRPPTPPRHDLPPLDNPPPDGPGLDLYPAQNCPGRPRALGSRRPSKPERHTTAYQALSLEALVTSHKSAPQRVAARTPHELYIPGPPGSAGRRPQADPDHAG